MTVKRHPWVKWYHSDWRAEPRLKMCGRAARSLWLDMLGLMEEAEPRGFLLIEGIAPNTAQLASLTGDPERSVKAWIGELEAAGVFSRVGAANLPDDLVPLIPAGLGDGVIFSRRILRVAAKEAFDRENGSSGGNPKLLDGVRRGVNPKSTRRTKKRDDGVNPNNKKRTRKSNEGVKAWDKAQIPETRNQNIPLEPPLGPPGGVGEGLGSGGRSVGQAAVQADGKAWFAAEKARLMAEFGEDAKVLIAEFRGAVGFVKALKGARFERAQTRVVSPDHRALVRTRAHAAVLRAVLGSALVFAVEA
jgi:hypothetical protein